VGGGESEVEVSGGPGSLRAPASALSTRRATGEVTLDGDLLETRRRREAGLRAGWGVLDEALGSLVAWGSC
jgi:hypothetical protein